MMCQGLAKKASMESQTRTRELPLASLSPLKPNNLIGHSMRWISKARTRQERHFISLFSIRRLRETQSSHYLRMSDLRELLREIAINLRTFLFSTITSSSFKMVKPVFRCQLARLGPSSWAKMTRLHLDLLTKLNISNLWPKKLMILLS